MASSVKRRKNAEAHKPDKRFHYFLPRLGSGRWFLSFSLFKMGILSICCRVTVIITEKLENDGLAVGEHNGMDGPLEWELQVEWLQQFDNCDPRKKLGVHVRWLHGSLHQVALLTFPKYFPRYLQFRLGLVAPGRASGGALKVGTGEFNLI